MILKYLTTLYKQVLQDLALEIYTKNSHTWVCSHSLYAYNPSWHDITGDHNIIQHEHLKTEIANGHTFREHQQINMNHYSQNNYGC